MTLPPLRERLMTGQFVKFVIKQPHRWMKLAIVVWTIALLAFLLLGNASCKRRSVTWTGVRPGDRVTCPGTRDPQTCVGSLGTVYTCVNDWDTDTMVCGRVVTLGVEAP